MPPDSMKGLAWNGRPLTLDADLRALRACGHVQAARRAGAGVRSVIDAVQPVHPLPLHCLATRAAGLTAAITHAL